MKRAFRILIFAATLTSLIQACANDVGDIDKSLLPHRVAIKSGDDTVISGYLYRPERADPAPAVLMLHGCSGMLTSKYRRLKSREKAWREIFLAEGYVVLLLDSFVLTFVIQGNEHNIILKNVRAINSQLTLCQHQTYSS